MDTGEFQTHRAPHEIEQNLKKQSKALQKLTILALVLIMALQIVLGFFGFRSLNILRHETGVEAQEARDSLLEGLLTTVDCTNQENLEVAVNTILRERNPDAPTVRIEFRDPCPRRDLPDPPHRTESGS